MTALTAAVAIIATAWATPTPNATVTGLATFYAPGVMEAVAVNRGLISETGEYGDWLRREGLAGAVALNRAGDLGRTVWLRGPDGLEGPFMVIDCARRDHYQDRIAQGRVVEVDWSTSRRWGMRGPVSVVVVFRFDAPDMAR